MKTETLVALVPLVYSGQNIATGQSFQAAPRDAKLLKLINRAAEAVGTEPAEFTALEDDGTPVAPDAPEAPEEKPRRAYKRRDMAAEG